MSRLTKPSAQMPGGIWRKRFLDSGIQDRGRPYSPVLCDYLISRISFSLVLAA